ncbi:hypothetical protein AB4Z48_34840 [Cupriavidus sp. 2TAF22]|uniref:hypothetical protein n=1 Tax=unclassified Cupriavidus TaxID=2640874 RepID=UPI003F8FCA0A
MQHSVEYRGFEIWIDMVGSSQDIFEAWYCLRSSLPPAFPALAEYRVKVHGGPFTRRWAVLAGELAGRSAVDSLLSRAQCPRM